METGRHQNGTSAVGFMGSLNRPQALWILFFISHYREKYHLTSAIFSFTGSFTMCLASCFDSSHVIHCRACKSITNRTMFQSSIWSNSQNCLFGKVTERCGSTAAESISCRTGSVQRSLLLVSTTLALNSIMRITEKTFGLDLTLPFESQGSSGSVPPTGPPAILRTEREVSDETITHANFKNRYQQ